MKNKWIWGLGALLILCFVVIGLSSRNKGTSGVNVIDLSKYPLTTNDHVRGSLTAKVVVVEYGDFQCPACAAYASLLKQTYEIYKGQVAIVFRHFPLVEIHTNALAGASAAEAAGMQGKFFEMSDILYTNQKDWSLLANTDDILNSYAKTLGLDVNKFQVDLKSKAVEDAVKAGREQAKSLGLSGTPTLFVNGKIIPLPNSGEEFQKVIEAELQKVNAKPTP